MSKNHLRCETTLGPLCGADGRVIRYSKANVTCKRCRAIAEKTPMIDSQTDIFLRRVALDLAERGIEAPTEADMIEGMRRTLERDEELLTAFCRANPDERGAFSEWLASRIHQRINATA